MWKKENVRIHLRRVETEVKACCIHRAWIDDNFNRDFGVMNYSIDVMLQLAVFCLNILIDPLRIRKIPEMMWNRQCTKMHLRVMFEHASSIYEIRYHLNGNFHCTHFILQYSTGFGQ